MTGVTAADTVFYFTPHKYFTLCEHVLEELLILSKCHCSWTTRQDPWNSANDIQVNQLHSCSHSAVCARQCDGKADGGVWGALMQVLTVSFSGASHLMWHINKWVLQHLWPMYGSQLGYTSEILILPGDSHICVTVYLLIKDYVLRDTLKC